jgi:hypothetical protein
LPPDLWADDDYSIVDPDINKRVGCIYPEAILGEQNGSRSCRPGRGVRDASPMPGSVNGSFTVPSSSICASAA